MTAALLVVSVIVRVGVPLKVSPPLMVLPTVPKSTVMLAVLSNSIFPEPETPMVLAKVSAVPLMVKSWAKASVGLLVAAAHVISLHVAPEVRVMVWPPAVKELASKTTLSSAVGGQV